MQHQVTAYIGIGSNLGEPTKQIAKAIEALATAADIDQVTASSLYRSQPMGGMAQPDYINAVARITTSLSAEQLLTTCQSIEQQQGRDRSAGHWSARTLDLDIILYGMQTIQSEHLTIPHYGMNERNFVLLPLAELDPDLLLPDNSSIQDALQNVSTEGLEKIEPS